MYMCDMWVCTCVICGYVYASKHSNFSIPECFYLNIVHFLNNIFVDKMFFAVKFQTGVTSLCTCGIIILEPHNKDT